jgi:hypothetical protein
MTPEVENVLNGIGWEVVKRASPLFAAQLGRCFSVASLADTDVQARRRAKEIERLLRDAHGMLSGLRALPDNVQRNIFLASVHPDELFRLSAEPDTNPLVQEVESVLYRLLRGLEATQAKLDFEAGGARSGPPKNLRPYKVAYAAAQIYVIGRCEMPVHIMKLPGRKLLGFLAKQ